MNTPSRRDTLLPPVPPALAETPVRCDQVLPAPPTGPLAGGCDWSAQGPPPALSVTVGGGGGPGQTILLIDCGRHTESSKNWGTVFGTNKSARFGVFRSL